MDMVGVAVLAADVAGAVVKTTVVGNPTDLLYFYPTLFLYSKGEKKKEVILEQGQAGLAWLTFQTPSALPSSVLYDPKEDRGPTSPASSISLQLLICDGLLLHKSVPVARSSTHSIFLNSYTVNQNLHKLLIH